MLKNEYVSNPGDLDVELVGIAVNNLRGFRNAYLPLHEGTTMLVGPNNAGKTSILRILDWVLNRASEDLLLGRKDLSSSELDLLVPARKTGGGARRIALAIRVADGRRRRRFSTDGEIATLRIGTTADGDVRLNVGPPSRSESRDETGAALDLLRAVRRCTEFGLVPASRDAGSESFTAALTDAVAARLEERAIHARRGGTGTDYRAIKKSLDALEKIAGDLVAPLWHEMKELLPAGLAERGELHVSVTPTDIVPWLADRARLRIVTGTHDVDSVPAVEVGSGLQSLLELSAQQAAASESGQNRILAIEEPESFLHPSAQRTLARTITEGFSGKLLISTHSALMVEEASYGDVVLVRQHEFHVPNTESASDEKRNDINSALLAGFGAEMAFAEGVLLVEGEGDRLFFEQLRRRVAARSSDGRMDTLYVVPTGSKTSFAPWLRLLASYGKPGARPVEWLAAPDGDGATDIRRAMNDAGLTVPQQITDALNATSNARHDRRLAVAAAQAANTAAEEHRVPINLLPGELEYLMTADCSDETVARLNDLIGSTAADAGALEAWLTNNKAPWMRAVIGQTLPWDEVSADAKKVMTRWMACVMPEADAQECLAAVN